MQLAHLQRIDRKVLAITGAEARDFLQGLISNDVNKLSPERALYAAHMTPQGKYHFHIFLFDDGATIFLDVQDHHHAAVRQRLMMYRLRTKCDIEDASHDYAIHVAIGDGVLDSLSLPEMRGLARTVDDGVVAVDPRHRVMGARAVLRAGSNLFEGFADLDPGTFDAHRMTLGIGEGEPDFLPQKSLLLENNFEELDGVDFQKGCYVGQEITARMKYRGLVKKQLLPVEIEGPAPESGTPVKNAEREVGELRNAQNGRGLALMRLEYLDFDAPMPWFGVGNARLRCLDRKVG